MSTIVKDNGTENANAVDEARETKLAEKLNDAFFKRGVDALSVEIQERLGLFRVENGKSDEYRDGYDAAILAVFRAIADARFSAKYRKS